MIPTRCGAFDWANMIMMMWREVPTVPEKNLLASKWELGHWQIIECNQRSGTEIERIHPLTSL